MWGPTAVRCVVSIRPRDRGGEENAPPPYGAQIELKKLLIWPPLLQLVDTQARYVTRLGVGQTHTMYGVEIGAFGSAEPGLRHTVK
jgi:hypothetical protein